MKNSADRFAHYLVLTRDTLVGAIVLAICITRRFIKNIVECVIMIGYSVYDEARVSPLRAVNCILLFLILFLLSLGRSNAQQLENWPPTSPPEVAKLYETGQMAAEVPCRTDLHSSYVCDLLVMPDGTGRAVMFDNQTNPVKILSISRDGRVKIIWERLSI